MTPALNMESISATGEPPSPGPMSPECESLIQAITVMMAENLSRVIDLFREWDDDENGTIDKVEFRRALPALGFKVEKSLAEELFDQFDSDRSGEISVEELQKMLGASLAASKGVELDDNLKAGAVKFTMEAKNKYALRVGLPQGVSGALGSKTKLLTGEGAPPILDQIRDALAKNLSRVINLFREWDDDGNGSVSKAEFRKGLSILGLDISKEDANALFDTLDADGGGTLEFNEMSKKLKPKAPTLPKVKSAPKLTVPPVFNGAERYKEALAAEQAAKRRLARIQKQLVRAASMASLQEQRQKNRLEVMAQRQAMDRLVGRDVTDRFADVVPADDEEVTALALMCHEKMGKVFVSPSWIKLFTWMDEDRSGRISYGEFESMVRSHLKLNAAKLSEERLSSLWKALDEDLSGFISAGEFGRFMKKGEKASTSNWRSKVTDRNQKLVSALRADADELSGKATAKQLRAVEAASEEEVTSLAELFTTRMAIIYKGTDCSWVKLFKFMDDDHSGRISYAEFKSMVRDKLKLTKEEYSDAQLETIWKAIDEDDSGYISMGEFGRMMRRAAALKKQQAASKDLEDETNRRKRVALEERAARQLVAKMEDDERHIAAARESEALAKQLEQDALRLEAVLKRGTIKGVGLRGSPSSVDFRHTRISSDAGDEPRPTFAQPAHPLLRPKKVGPGVDF